MFCSFLTGNDLQGYHPSTDSGSSSASNQIHRVLGGFRDTPCSLAWAFLVSEEANGGVGLAVSGVPSHPCVHVEAKIIALSAELEDHSFCP